MTKKSWFEMNLELKKNIYIPAWLFCPNSLLTGFSGYGFRVVFKVIIGLNVVISWIGGIMSTSVVMISIGPPNVVFSGTIWGFPFGLGGLSLLNIEGKSKKIHEIAQYLIQYFPKSS